MAPLRHRGLLVHLALLGALACAEGAQGPAAPPGDPARATLQAWTRLREALRASPDHLPERAADLVVAGDPAALFEFVRDRIGTVPPSEGSLADALTRVRWGVRGTLRGGAGTPREKADLLADLYRQAGFEAEVVRGRPDPAKVDGAALLMRVPDRHFRPDLPDDEAERLRAAAGGDAPPLADPDPEQRRARDLAAALDAQLPPAGAAAFDFGLPDAFPLVRVRVDGAWVHANPSVPGLPFGDPGTVGEPVGTTLADAPEAVRVKVEGSHADRPFERFTLAEGQWTAEEVTGRTVSLVFVPPARPEDVTALKVRDASAFVPVLRVSGPGLDRAGSEALSRVGTPVTRSGEVIEIVGDAALLDGEPLPDPGTDPAILASVASARASASAGAFPRIRVRVGALGPDGRNVPRLGVEAFEVREDGVPVPFALRRSEAPPPRIAMLFDQSGSVPEAFRGAGAAALAQDLATRAFAWDPGTRIRVATVSAGARWAAETWATTADEAAVQAAWLAGPGAVNPGSEIWTAVFDAGRIGATLVVVLTDGVSTDAFDPGLHGNAFASGPPVVAVGVGEPDGEWLRAVAALTGGLWLPPAEPAEVADGIFDFLQGRSVEAYELAYPAPREGPPSRQVQVLVDRGRVAASTSYEVPPDPVPGPVLSGVHLTLRVGGREVVRTLAGFGGDFVSGPVTVAAADLQDVESLLFGRVTLRVEGPAPTPSVFLDDLLTERIEAIPLLSALAARDDAAVREAYHAGFQVTSPRQWLLAGIPAPASPDAVSFDTGLRAVLLVEKSPPGDPRLIQSDLFPLMRWTTVARDPLATRTATIEAGARLAVAESDLFPDATLSRLAGRALRRVDGGDLGEGPVAEALSLAAKPFRSDWWILMPEEGPGDAFWAVHKASGSLMGVLADGSGGGVVDDATRTMQQSDGLLSLLGDMGGIFGLELGGWVLYAKVQVKLWTRATIVLSGGPDPGWPWDPLAAYACGQVADPLAGVLPGVSAYLSFASLLNDLLELGRPGTPDLPTLCG